MMREVHCTQRVWIIKQQNMLASVMLSGISYEQLACTTVVVFGISILLCFNYVGMAVQ